MTPTNHPAQSNRVTNNWLKIFQIAAFKWEKYTNQPHKQTHKRKKRNNSHTHTYRHTDRDKKGFTYQKIYRATTMTTIAVYVIDTAFLFNNHMQYILTHGKIHKYVDRNRQTYIHAHTHTPLIRLFTYMYQQIREQVRCCCCIQIVFLF